MRTITAIAAKSLGKFLAKDFRQIFGSAQETAPNDLVLWLGVQWNALAELMRSIITSSTQCL
jgi:hypothetical protein